MKKAILIFVLGICIFYMQSCSKCQTCKQYTREYDQSFTTIKADTSFIVVCDRKEQKYYKNNPQQKHTLSGKTIIIDTYCE